MSLELSITSIEGLILLKPQVYNDNRGHFFESYNEALFGMNNINARFIQENQSLSGKNILK